MIYTLVSCITFNDESYEIQDIFTQIVYKVHAYTSVASVVNISLHNTLHLIMIK